METRDSGRVQERMIKKLERQEKQEAFQRDRFLRFKLPEIHNRLSQALLMNKIIETDNPAAVSTAILNGLKKALRSSDFDIRYFISPIRDLVPRPNPYSLYMTQYIMEVVIEDPHVIEIYGTDEEIYGVINQIFSHSYIQFEKAEEAVIAQLARNKSLQPGSREYDIQLEQLLRKMVGEPQK